MNEDELRKGEALFEEGRMEEAKAIFLSIIEQDARCKEAYNNVGVIAFQKGEKEHALACFSRVLEIDPFYREAIENLAFLLRTTGRLRAIIPLVQRFVEEQPHDDEMNKLFQEASDAENHDSFAYPVTADTSHPVTEKREGVSGRKPLKILYLADCRSQHARRYACYFKDRGHEVHIFDTSGHTDKLDGIILHFAGAPPGGNGTHRQSDIFIHTVQALNRVIEDVGPDIMHGHYLTGWCWWGCLTGFQPFVITPWGSDIFLDIRRPFNKRFTSFCLKESPLLTADSKDLLEATARLREDRRELHYVPFGIDTDFFRPGYDTTSLAERLGIRGRRVVLSPRQFKPEANIHVLIEAVPQIVEKLPDTVFILKTYLTGNGVPSDYERSLRTLVKERKVENQVIFLHDIDFHEMPVLYNLADVMVTLRDTDGSSCSMLESMACKTPVVASNIESMREWIRDGKNGKLVNQHDPGNVASAIIEILSHKDRGKQFSTEAYPLVKEKADYRKNWAAVEEFYYGILEKNTTVEENRETGEVRFSPELHDIHMGWRCVRLRQLGLAGEAFTQILATRQLPMYLYLKALAGMGKVEWLKGHIQESNKHYMSCLQILANFELDKTLDTQSAKDEGDLER